MSKMLSNALLETVINTCVDNNIEVIIKKNQLGEIVYDLDVRAKSGLAVTPSGESLICYGRYNLVKKVDTLEELLFQIKGCLYGRNYINEHWLKILEKEKIVVIETIIEKNIY